MPRRFARCALRVQSALPMLRHAPLIAAMLDGEMPIIAAMLMLIEIRRFDAAMLSFYATPPYAAAMPIFRLQPLPRRRSRHFTLLHALMLCHADMPCRRRQDFRHTPCRFHDAALP